MTEYHFDANGQLTGMTYPSGRVITYSFDGLARVYGLTTTVQTQTTNLANNIQYLPFGPMTNLTYGNNKTLTQSYDLDYRLTNKTTSGLHQMVYGYDLTDNITSINDSLNINQNQSFSYDKLSRLLNASGDYGLLDFTYDKVGNRTSKTENTAVDNYVYAVGSHQLSSITGVNTRSFTHDAIGNTLTKDGLTFTYNQQGRLATASKVGMNAAYLYNYKGERVSKQVDGVTQHFIYDLNGQLIAEADSNGVIQQEYIYLNGQRLANVINGTIYYVHTDHLGTPIALTDSAGAVQWKAHYTPFGKLIVDVNNVVQEARFPGQYFDAETGLHYNYFRDYDPEIGRYLQSDPIGLNGGINTYGYVGGNPIMYYDQYGLCWGWGCPLPQSVVDASAGLGDALLFGTGQYWRDLLNIDGGVNKCSNAYDYGGYAALGAGGARLAYAGLAKGGSLIISSARNAVNYRQGLKVFFRGGLFPNFRRKTYEALVAAGKTDAEIIVSSGVTNLRVNQAGALVGAGGAVQSSNLSCECE